jgi:D-alanine-D-alanine ligase
VAWCWQTKKGLANGTLIISQLDVPFEQKMQFQGFRRDPEWLYGEGIGSVWAPLTMLEFSLRSLRFLRRLKNLPLSIMLYGDEGLDCRYSSKLIQEACDRASQVIVLRPGNMGGKIISQRRGQRKYFLMAEGAPRRLGMGSKRVDVFRWVNHKLELLAGLSSRRERIALAAVDVKTDSYPMLLPHRVTVSLLSSFPTKKAGDELEAKIRQTLGRSTVKWSLEMVSDRPPMKTRQKNNPLFETFNGLGEQWSLPFGLDSSVWPSVAGLVKPGTPVACGMGPYAKDLYTLKEAVERISLVQRTLLLSQFLVGQVRGR